MSNPVALGALLAPAALALVALAPRAGDGRAAAAAARTARRANLASLLGVAVAAIAAAAVALQGTIESPALLTEGLGASVRLDGLSVTMLLMVALLALPIVRYSTTYLEGDERHDAFLRRLVLTVAAVQVLLLAGNLALLFAAWVATSLALHQLLLFYPERRRAVAAARKKFVVARLGDGLLLAAIVLLWQEAGSGQLGEVFATATADPGALGTQVAAVCIVLAAALKSAQFPTHGWLVEVMETPTPVSALLHAGILNAGVFLVIRTSFVIDQVDAATLLLIAIGTVTAAFASVSLLTQPSVKVALGYSSAAHMGFMLMVCGAGVYAAALLHLVAHSFYKAHAFLSSGSAIDEARAADVPLPARLGHPGRIALSATLAFATYAALSTAFGIGLTEDPVLLVIGLFLVLGTTQIIAPALDAAGKVGPVALRAVGMAAAVTLAFFSLEAGALQILDSSAAYDGERSAAHLALLGGVVLAFAAIIAIQIVHPARTSTRRTRRLAVHLRNGFYASAAFDRLLGVDRLGTTATATAPPTHPSTPSLATSRS